MLGHMNLVTSYSSIHNYMSCPRAWYLRDLRRLGPILDKRTGALGFGSRFHHALEAWGDGTVADPVEAWHQLMAHEYGIAAERDGLGVDELDKENTLGVTMFEGFRDWYAAEGEDQEFEVIAVEKKLSNELEVHTPDGEVVEIWLYGKLDQVLRHRDSGQFWIKDWKTTKNLEDATKETLENSPQPRIYASLLRQELPDMPVVGIRYTMFRKVLRTGRGKPPWYFNYDMHLSNYNIEHHLQRVSAITGKMVDTARKLEAGVPHVNAAPFNPSWQCKTCPFRNPCYVMQTAGMQAAEDMLEDQFHEVDPLARYKTEAEEATVVGTD